MREKERKKIKLTDKNHLINPSTPGHTTRANADAGNSTYGLLTAGLHQQTTC